LKLFAYIHFYRIESFESARDWKKEIENNADREVLVYLVGNRCDLGDGELR
jgi:GTPase SAR1 family protein